VVRESTTFKPLTSVAPKVELAAPPERDWTALMKGLGHQAPSFSSFNGPC
jgi:hypothetical protein